MEILPIEIREEIFTYLSCDDLMRLMLVDKCWRNIVENSPRLMSKLPIFIVDEEEYFDENKRFIEPVLNSSRKVTRVVVKLKCEKIMNYCQIFKKFGSTICSLEIHHYAFDSIDQLRIVLRYLTNLKKLTVIHVQFLKPENKILNAIVQIPKLSLHDLHEVNCVNSDPKIFALFTNNYDIKLRKIRLALCDVQYTVNCVEFCETMIQQTSVKTLMLDSVTSRKCNLFDYENFLQGQLSHLEFTNCDLTRKHMRNMINLIKMQRQLKTLKIINTPIPSQIDVIYVYRQLLANTINELHIDINQLPFVRSHQFTNFSVRNLSVHGNFAFENLPIFINFIKIFPNVRRLKLIGDVPIGDKYLFHILTTFTQLKELKVAGFTSRTTDSNFSNLAVLDVKLKCLELDYIDYDVKFFGWKNIVTSMRSIEKLIIKRDYCNVSNETVDIIIKTLRLRHLELGEGIVSDDILRNVIYNNYCDDLKVLKISKTDFDKISGKIDFSKLFRSNQLLLYHND